MNEQFKRIILDIKDMIKSPIEGIYYLPDEDNITYGYALIFGPKNTPYQNGNFMFKFEFPKLYPYEPPLVTYLSNDGQTRFNPNFYRNGKVCLSILNTWVGESWSACQSIRSVLLTLQITMNEEPFLNEPGMSKNNHSIMIKDYNDMIEYKTIEKCIIQYNKDSKVVPIHNIECRNTIIQYIKQNFNHCKQDIIDILTKRKNGPLNNKTLMSKFYNFSVFMDYNKLLNDIKKLNTK